MQDERFIILKMLEEGKINAVEALALIEALEEMVTDDPKPNIGADSGDQNDQTEDGETYSATWAAFSREIGDHIRESVQMAAKNVPHLAEELKDGWHSLKEDLKRSLSEVRDEVNKGIAIDIGGMKKILYRGRHEYVRDVKGTWTEKERVRHIKLLTRNGSIALREWDETFFQVTVRTSMRGIIDEARAKHLADEVVDIDWDEDRLDVMVKRHERVFASIEVHVPKGGRYDVEAVTRNGGLVVEGVDALTAKMTSTNGGVTLSGLSATQIDVHTTNGRILCHGVDADTVNATTTNGGVSWKGTAQRAFLQTTNGAIRVEPEVGAGSARLRAKTTNAAIEVVLPDDDGVGLNVHAVGSSVDTSEIEHISWHAQRGNARYETQVTGKSPEFESAERRLDLDVKTTNGRVNFRR